MIEIFYLKNKMLQFNVIFKVKKNDHIQSNVRKQFMNG